MKNPKDTVMLILLLLYMSFVAYEVTISANNLEIIKGSLK